MGLIKRLLRWLFRKNKRTNAVYTTYHPRKLARSVAKANMERSGMKHINRNFAQSWKQWVFVIK